MLKREKHKLFFEILMNFGAAAISALAFHIFVFTASFAPMGFEGIGVFISFLTGFNAGYVGLILNIPVLFIAYFFINRRYVVHTIVFIVVLNCLLLLFDKISLFQYKTAENNYLLAAIFSGLVRGFACAMTLLAGGSTGGVDIIVSLIQKKRNHLTFDRIFLILNIIIIMSTFFVFGQKLDSVFLSVVYLFCYSKAIEITLKGPKSAVVFNVITDHGDEISSEIMLKLKRGVTVIPAKGAYSGTDKKYLICLINKREIGPFRKIVRSYSDTFAFIQESNDVIGYFWRNKQDRPQ